MNRQLAALLCISLLGSTQATAMQKVHAQNRTINEDAIKAATQQANNPLPKSTEAPEQIAKKCAPYLSELEKKIANAWFPPKGNEYKRVSVCFHIHRGGELSNLRLNHSSGVAITDLSALKGVENAAPFKPLPAGVDALRLQVAFDKNRAPAGTIGGVYATVVAQ
ncbi:MAG: TonB family protein [Cyanobacteria bacterium SZAS-4]|nr:TonB family protein [Cyanobacteria bacterium SZAS-4]